MVKSCCRCSTSCCRHLTSCCHRSPNMVGDLLECGHCAPHFPEPMLLVIKVDGLLVGCKNYALYDFHQEREEGDIWVLHLKASLV